MGTYRLSDERREQIAHTTARYYKRNFSLTSYDDVVQDAYVAVLTAEKSGSYKPELGEPGQHAYGAAARWCRSGVWKASSPVSASKASFHHLRKVRAVPIPATSGADKFRTPASLELRRDQTEDNRSRDAVMDTFLQEAMHPPTIEEDCAEAEWRLRVSEAIHSILPEGPITDAVLRVLTGDSRPKHEADALGITRQRMARAIAQARDRLACSRELFERWTEIGL